MSQMAGLGLCGPLALCSRSAAPPFSAAGTGGHSPASAPQLWQGGRPHQRSRELPVARVAEGASASAAPSAEQQDFSSWPSAACRAAAFSSTPLEEATGVPAAVTGRLPAWLSGAYFRNGPGGYDNGGEGGMVHLFDGFALLLKLDIDGASNTVTASHRFLQSAAYRHYKETGRQKWREFGTAPPVDGPLGRLADAANTVLGSMGLSQGVTDNASVNLGLAPDGSLVAMTETVQGTYRVDPATLRTLGQVAYADDIRGDLTTAHPTVLPGGDVVNLVSTVGTGFQVYRQAGGAGGGAPRRRLAVIPHRRPLAPAWVHDFPVTPAHAVVPDTPIYFNLGALVAGGTTDHIFMDWAPEDGAVLHVVPLSGGGAVRSYRAPAFFCFHWVNAFESEDGRYLHLDASVYDDPQICNDLYLANARRGPPSGAGAADAGVSRSYYRRLTIDLRAPDGSEVGPWQPLVDDEESFGAFFDFPAVNPSAKGRPYRFAWGGCATRPTNAGNSLVKFDNQQRTARVWHEAGVLAGEPVFVPAPGAAAEDEGVLLSVIVQADGGAALVFLDGQSHAEVARARLPYQLSNGFHGRFVARAAAK